MDRWGKFPRDGGLDDQDPYFLEDLNTWLERERMAEIHIAYNQGKGDIFDDVPSAIQIG